MPSDAVLNALIAEGQARPLPDLVRREVRLPDIPGKAVALIGMRRSGKTYRLWDEMRRAMADGMPRAHMLHLNFEDDRLGRCDLGTLTRALELFYARAPEARVTGAWIFLDEVQLVVDWERFARRVLDTEAGRLFVTGSSARMLSTEVHTAFRGRSIAVEVLPFSPAEAAAAAGHTFDLTRWPPSAAVRSQLDALAARYLRVGGFPATFDLPAFDRIQVLQDYVDLVVQRDVAERHGATSVGALRDLVAALFAANANGFSVNRLHGSLNSQGRGVGKSTLLRYLDYLVDAFLVFLLPMRTRSARQRAVNPRKVYAVDPGLAAAMYRGGASNRGAQLENAVYLQIRRALGRLTEKSVGWYRTPSGYEVDFAIDDPIAGGPPALVQVSESLSAPETRAREVRALIDAMVALKTQRAVIVTLMDEEQIETDAGVIEVVPARDWFFGPGVRRVVRLDEG